jgi:hypothetical protein
LGGSEHKGGTRDERGTLIPFPRSGWIPADGIEPLNTEDPQPSSTTEPGIGVHQNGAEQRTGSATIEADDFWASGDTQEFVGAASAANGSEPPPAVRLPELRQRFVRPQVGVALAATVLIAIAGVAAWQVSSSTVGVAKRSADLAASARHSRPSATYPAASNRTTTGLRTTEVPQLHRAILVSHSKAHANKTGRHRAKAVHRGTTPPQIIPVSYGQSAPANSPANTSNGSSPAASSPPQQSASATTAGASGGSGSSSSSSPPQPGPNGALTCISNCG